ncbi:hypothetical protein DPEC_G00334120 [Dallia pectoralis]|uniref:Uncharacterized protein n=1 Tax=Dallia pectoralis TaxID=75939 RepID=A0ACC2F6H0_DALPE|nr:hypothetical protein DPEC_G00334120 [Dallia pectoralis]
MPIIKLPVVHHLGIISQKHKEDLQKSLKKSQGITLTTYSKVIRNPFEIVTEQFIKQYSISQGSEEQEKFVELARQLLSRSKRRAGLKCMGEGDHVNLPLAWTELLLLGLCPGRIQNESLVSLLMSLDHAPVHVDQIPALFYLLESALYNVCSDTSEKTNMSTYKTKILKLGYLAILRLFLFHITGNLSGYQKSKSHLSRYLKAFCQCESVYEPYTNIFFSVHFILRAGEIICGPGCFERVLRWRMQTHDSVVLTSFLHFTHVAGHILDASAILLDSLSWDPADCQEYDVNQVLWHCLLSWYCVQNNVSQLSQVTDHLILLKDELQKDNWVDCALGLMVLGEAAKSSLLCLQLLLSLHINSKTEDDGILEANGRISQMNGWPWQLEHIYFTVLADICLHGTNAEIQKTALLGSQNPQGYYITDGLLKCVKNSGAEDWRMRCSAVQALVCVFRGLSGAVLQDGLRNAAWLVLHEHLGQETDQRVHEASNVIEAEMNVPESSVFSERQKLLHPPASSLSGHFITWRLACTLSQFYLPPMPVQVNPRTRAKKKPPHHSTGPWLKASPPRPKETTRSPRKSQHPTKSPEGCHSTQGGSKKSQAYTDFIERTNDNLMSVVENQMHRACQWQKELQIILAEEKDAAKDELEKAQKENEKHLQEIMRRRMEKVRKDTKPYELPLCQLTGGLL